MDTSKTHQELFDELKDKLVPGTRVRIARKIPTYHAGWSDSWVHEMDDLLGEVVTIGPRTAKDRDGGVTLGHYDYPIHALDIIPNTTPDAIKKLIVAVDTGNLNLIRKASRELKTFLRSKGYTDV